MTTKDEALQMALDAEYSKSYLDDLADVHGTRQRKRNRAAPHGTLMGLSPPAAKHWRRRMSRERLPR